MAPNITSAPTGVLFEGESLDELRGKLTKIKDDEAKSSSNYKVQIVWRNVIIFVVLHVGALYGLYLAVSSAKIATTVFGENFDCNSNVYTS